MSLEIDQKALERVMGPAWPMATMIFNDLPLGVVIADIGGMVAYYNQAQLSIDGLKFEDVNGRFLSDIYSPFTTSIILNCLAAQKPVLNHWQLYDSPTLKNIQAISNALPLFKDGKLSGCISFTKGYPKVELDDYLSDIKSEPQPANLNISFGRLVGRSSNFIRAVKAAEAASENHLPVLIYGETGVGKELFARGIHNSSSRADQPFVPVNCSAIPENLFESLMFGISRGAFTGAIDKAGFFEEANGGTIYLDEIDSMPLSLQPKVLRVLQEGEVRRLGSNLTLKLDVKIVSSMSQEPLKVVEVGRFRSDLFYRLGAIIINIPPLRERLDDLQPLLDHFISKYSASLGKPIKRVSHDFMELLQKSSWPGNVRELEHIVTGAITMAKPRQQTIGTDLMPEYFKNVVFHAQHSQKKAQNHEVISPDSQEPSRHGRLIEKDISRSADSYVAKKNQLQLEEERLIRDYLAKSFGNVALASRLMNLSPQTLHYKIKKYAIKVTDFK